MAINVLAIGSLYTINEGDGAPLGGGVGRSVVAARGLGDSVRAAGRVGLDPAGSALVAAMRSLGADDSTMQTDPDLPTGRRIVRGGGARLDTYCAFDNLQWDSDLETAARAADVVLADVCGRRHGQARSTMDRALLAATAAVRVIDLVARPPRSAPTPTDTAAPERIDREWIGRGLELADLAVVDSVALATIFPSLTDPREAAKRLREELPALDVLLLLPDELVFLARGGTRATRNGSDAPLEHSALRGLEVARAIAGGRDPF